MKRLLSLMITAALTAGLAFSAVPCIAASAEEDDRPVVFAETQQPETAPESGSETAEAEETGTQNEDLFPSDQDRTEQPSDEAADLPAEETGEAEAQPDTEEPDADPSDQGQTEEPAEDTSGEPAGDTPEEPADPETTDLSGEPEEFAVIEEKEDAASEETETLKAAETGEKIELASATLPNSKLVYTGAARTQTKSAVVTALVDGEEKTLTLYKDYSVSYKNNIEIGTATITFTGKGRFTGSIEKTFKIIPVGTSVSSITPGTRCFAVKWKKQADHVRGYHIQYALKDDFSDKTSIYIKDNTVLSQRITGLASNKTYYVRVRTFQTVDGVNYYSKWSAVKDIKLAYNTLKITGSGVTRTAVLMNPKNSVDKARIAVWSNEGSKDDKVWYTMKKDADGSWKATIQSGYLKRYGECTVKCFTGSTFLDEITCTFTKAEYNASKNTILTGGSGYTRNLRLIHPSGIKKPTVAIWSEEGGQDDLKWYDLEKQPDGTWLAVISTLYLAHGGTINAHLYTNDGKDFVKSTTFTCKLSHSGITWNPSWEFASYSKVHTGTAKLYRATKNRKGIVVGVNAGHGTILPAGQDNYVYSHPDKTPKTTGGSTQAGAVWTICDNSGMTFADGTPEAQVTLEEAQIFKEVLLEAGYDVIMIRENHDSGLDVIARTVICNELADCHISIHWDGDGLGYDKGVFFMSVADGIKGMYPTSTIWSESDRLGRCVIQGMQKKGIRVFEGGAMQMDLMQTSYSKVPSIDIELGNQVSSHTASDLKARAEAMLAGLDLFFGE